MFKLLGNKIAYVFTFVFAFPAFLVALLTLFAGSTPAFLPQGNMLSVDLSQIGKTAAFGRADLSKCKRAALGPDFLNDIGDDVDCGIQQAKNGAQNIQNAIADKLAEVANLPGFVDLHVMNFCTGQFDPKDYVAQGITNPKKDRNFCSPKIIDFSFSLTDVVQRALPNGVSLRDLRWPDAITKAESGLRTVSKVMIILYLVGVGSAAFITLTSILGFWIPFGWIGSLNMIVAGVGVLALLIASAASTATIKKVVPQINELGGPIGIKATEGIIFISLSWAATGLLLILLLIGIVQWRKHHQPGQSMSSKLFGFLGGRNHQADQSAQQYDQAAPVA